jgi:erythronate-4-phosphate dehydrogenase
MITIIADSNLPFLKGILEPFARMIYLPGDRITIKEAIEADGLIIRTRTHCDARLLEGTPVKFIATATIGYDQIDTEYCDKKGIRWFNAPGCNASAVGHYVASSLAWLAEKHRFRLNDKTIGIIGAGNTGSQVLKVADAFGMKVLLNDPPRERKEGKTAFVSIDRIAQEADIISFHVPLITSGIDKTLHLADKSFLASFKRRPFLINSSRGEVVLTEAVKEALQDGLISGAVFDVWENEPYLDLDLLEKADLGTAHIAGHSVDGKANGTAICVQAASRFFGFGIDDWLPESLPPPETPVITIQTEGKDNEDIISEAILKSYDIPEDDILLRQHPEQFESLRDNYHIRRDFNAFTIRLVPGIPTVFTALKKLGFSTE